MAESSFEEILSRDGRLIYSNVGDSMLPLLRQGRDLLIVEQPKGRLKKYDVPLYRRDNGQAVLHRILKVRENDYVICGDNRFRREYGVTDAQILGVLESLVRGGREIPLRGWKYRLYEFFWCDLFPLRAFVLKAGHVLKRKGKQ